MVWKVTNAKIKLAGWNTHSVFKIRLAGRVWLHQDNRKCSMENTESQETQNQIGTAVDPGGGHLPNFCMQVCQRSLRNCTLSLAIFLKKDTLSLAIFW